MNGRETSTILFNDSLSRPIVRRSHIQYPAERLGRNMQESHTYSVHCFLQTMTGEGYLRLLEDHSNPGITDILESDHELEENLVTYQQNKSPVNIDRQFRTYLGRYFPVRGGIR